MKPIETGHANQTTPSWTKGVENLRGRISPHLKQILTFFKQVIRQRYNCVLFIKLNLGIFQLAPIWQYEIRNALAGARQRHAAYEQSEQHHIREQNREVNNLQNKSAISSLVQ